MDREQVAAILAEIGTFLEIQGENKFRCLAYHNAARAVQQMTEDLLGWPTDVVERRSLKRFVRPEVEREAVTVF